MASNKRTIYLGLDYSQFSGGITEINRKMGLLDAEFKLATEQAKNYGNETDKTGLKQEYLTQKIELQKKKVEEAERAYDKIMSTQGASQKEIDNLDKKLLQERTTLEKLNGELKDEEDATNKATKANKSFGDEIRDVASMLGLQASPAVEALAKKFDGVSAAAGNAIIVIGGLGKKLYDWAKETATWADELKTLSDQTGITTDELQKLDYASKFIDVDVDTMTGSMEKMIRSMNQARDGSGQAAEAFRKLGVRITDSHGQLRDQQEVFYDTIDALGKIKNETERDAKAMEIFGKSARDLNPLIKQGSQTLKDLGEEAEKLGHVMSSDEIAKAGQLNDAFDKLNDTFETAKKNLAMALIPVLTDLINAIASLGPETLALIAKIGMIVIVIVEAVKVINQLTSLGSGLKSLFDGISAGSAMAYVKILLIVAAITALAIAIGVLIGKGSEYKSTFDAMGDSLGKVTGSVDSAVDKSKYAQQTARNASGTDYFRGGKTWVGEEGPELVTLPRGTKIEPASNNTRTEYNTFYVTIDAKNVSDFNRVVELARNQRMAERRTR